MRVYSAPSVPVVAMLRFVAMGSARAPRIPDFSAVLRKCRWDECTVLNGCLTSWRCEIRNRPELHAVVRHDGKCMGCRDWLTFLSLTSPMTMTAA